MRPVFDRTVVWGCLLALACSSGGEVQGGNTNNGAEVGGSPLTAAGGAASEPSNGDGGSGIVIGSGGDENGGAAGAGGSDAFDPENACTAGVAEGERLPVDLYFMVDTTGSMNCPVPDSPSSPCEVDPGPPYSDTTRWVVESAALKSFIGSPKNVGMSVGIGFFPSRRNYCSANNYVTPAVEIAALPGAVNELNAAIDAQNPNGNTPTVASLTGALEHASAWAKAHPGRRTAVVYSTDGYPVGCRGSTIDGAAAVAQAALAADGIKTYVLGMGQNLSSLNQIAAAGGTEEAYLIDTGKDAAAQLAQALSSIRNNALQDCTYTIPPPPPGKVLDYDKVNVRYTNSSGEIIDAFRDPAPSACVQGWQYSEDKTQVNLCGDFCQSVKTDTEGRLEVLFGCKTKISQVK